MSTTQQQLAAIVNVDKAGVTPSISTPTKVAYTLEALSAKAGIQLTPELRQAAHARCDWFGNDDQEGFWFEVPHLSP